VPERVPDQHPLRHLFERLVRARFFQDLNLYDIEISRYVAGVLTDFTHAEHLYRIRDAQGQTVEAVAEMLVEANPLLEANSFDRERAVRKQIGDFTLFLTGLFPEHVGSRFHVRRVPIDAFIDYVRVGKQSYAVVAAFNLFEYRHEAPLFRRLSDRFELCVHGLNLVKADLEQMEQADYRSADASLN
jgi:hypothetical protein